MQIEDARSVARKEAYDVIVVGGGIAGVAAALCAKENRAVGAIDAAEIRNRI